MAEGKKSWSTEIVVALIGLAGTVGTVGVEYVLPDDDEKDKAKSAFVYSVQTVTSEGGKSISVSKAEVILEIPGRTPLRKKTDKNGMARLSVDDKLKGKQAELVVEAKGYKSFKEGVDLVEQLPYKVKLAAKSPFDTEQPVLTETEEKVDKKVTIWGKNLLKKGQKKEGKLSKGSSHNYQVRAAKNQPLVLRTKGDGTLQYVVKISDKHDKLLLKKGPYRKDEQTTTYIPKTDNILKVTVEGFKRSGYYTLETL